MRPWMLWALAMFGAWVLWYLYRGIRQARLEAPMREAGRIADELTREGDIARMVATYQQGDLASRLGAVLALATTESEEATPPLVAALDSESLEIRVIAANALGRTPGDDASRALLEKGLGDPSTMVRASAIRALGGHEHVEAVPAIASALKRGLLQPVANARELQIAAHVLAILGDKRGMWALKDAQACEVKRVREAATQAMSILELRGRLEKNPKDAAAARDLGAHYMAASEFERARKTLTRAVELDPGDANAHMVLGTAYEVLDDPDRALAEYREAARLDPGNGVAQIAVGDLLARIGPAREARRAYERFLELHPDSAQAGRVRAALRELE